MIPIKRWESLTAMFFEQAETQADKAFLHWKSDGKWQKKSWADTAKAVGKLATALESLGVGKGDRVVLVSENRPRMADC